jgi:hypothetical protein
MTFRPALPSSHHVMKLFALIPLLSAATATAQEAEDEVPVAPPATVQPMPPPPPPTAVPPGYVLVPVNAQTAPQTEPWTNVSNVNGQVVPVGQRGDYLYKFKRTNISTNPIGWIVGIYGVSVETALNDNLALRFDANYFAMHDTHETGYEVGVSLPIYFKRTYQGPFLEPGIIVRGFHDTTDEAFAGDTSSQDKAHAGPSVVFGWHWTFDSGLNVAMAFGVMRNMNTDQMNSSGDDIEPSGYFRVGYAF